MIEEYAALVRDVAALRDKVLELSADGDRLDWLQSVMTSKDNYCEVFFAGLRPGPVDATAYQIESNPEVFPTLAGKTVRDAIDVAREALIARKMGLSEGRE